MHGINAPSPGGRPSTPVSVGYLSTRPLYISSRSIAATVDTTHRSFPGKKPTANHQQRRIERFRSIVFDEHIALWIEAMAANVAINLVAQRSPSIDRTIAGEFLSPIDQTAHPRHHLRVRKIPPQTTHFPDSLIRFLPARVGNPISAVCKRQASSLRSSLYLRATCSVSITSPSTSS